MAEPSSSLPARAIHGPAGMSRREGHLSRHRPRFRREILSLASRLCALTLPSSESGGLVAPIHAHEGRDARNIFLPRPPRLARVPAIRRGEPQGTNA
ncbi:hypothetical protein BGLA2_1260012 [Burkholderia gladioli]|nr:hypothetical protein BGLA2_1260012 [Burkholderia gladioli]